MQEDPLDEEILSDEIASDDEDIMQTNGKARRGDKGAADSDVE